MRNIPYSIGAFALLLLLMDTIASYDLQKWSFKVARLYWMCIYQQEKTLEQAYLNPESNENTIVFIQSCRDVQLKAQY